MLPDSHVDELAHPCGGARCHFAEVIRNARGMAEQMAQVNRLPGRRAGMKVATDGVVDGELGFLLQPQDRDRGERLRQRSDTEYLVDIIGHIELEVCPAKS